MHAGAIGRDEDWEILGEKWWCNSFGTVTWAYPPPRRRTGSPASSPKPAASRFKPPYYHDLLLRPYASRRRWSVCCDQCQEVRDPLCPCEAKGVGGSGRSEEVELRQDLLGVEMVRKVLEAYEKSVGIVTTDDREVEVDIAALAARVVLLNGDIPATGLAQDRWRQQAEETFRDTVTPLDPDVLRDLLASPPDDAQPVPSFLDRQLDPSLPLHPEEEKEPLPETPKPRTNVPSIKEQVDMVLRKFELVAEREPEDSDSQDDLDALSIKRRLSRPPSSPSSTSSSPATSTSDELQSVSSYHTARTRSNSLPSVNLKRDDQGFFNSIEDDGSPDDPVPSFLVHNHRSRKPMSKTRAIVDSMREGTEDEDEKRGAIAFSVSRLFQRTGDGWIRMVSEDVPDKDKKMGLRSADPFHNPAEDASDLEDLWPGSTLASPFAGTKKLADKAVKQQQKHGRRASTTVTSGDGWMDTSSNKDVFKPNPTQRKHRSRSTQMHPPPGSVGKFTIPPPPPLPPMPMQSTGYSFPYAGPNMPYAGPPPPAFSAYAAPAVPPAYPPAFAYPMLGAPGYGPSGPMFPGGGFGGPSLRPPWL